MGSGTTAVAAETLNRRWIGIELSENYTNIAKDRVKPFVASNRQLKLDI
jgi:DNA modification methylase